MTATKSKYEIEERPDGFVVRAVDRNTVFVDLRETGFNIETTSRWRQLALLPDSYLQSCREDAPCNRLGLCEYRRLCHLVCDSLMSDWQGRKDGAAPIKIRLWAQKQTQKALGRRLHQQWKRLIARVDPRILGVQRAVFATSFRAPQLLHDVSLYAQNDFVRDIQQYRAAAHLVDITSQYAETPLLHVPRSVECLSALNDWQEAYAVEGKRYRSLSRTLMNLPGNMPSGVVATLRRVHLERPITDRLELLTLLLARQESFQPIGYPQNWTRLFQHVRRAEILAAMSMVSQAIRVRLSPRRTRDIFTFVSYLLDYPEPFTGRLRGVTRRAIRWHAHNIAGEMSAFDNQQAVSLPPIDLPSNPAVRFLSTVGDIREEAARMQHCVASYAKKAMDGGCYLFHIEHAGHEATVEVASNGRVRQSCGPRNTRNVATVFGQKVLHQWAATLALPF